MPIFSKCKSLTDAQWRMHLLEKFRIQPPTSRQRRHLAGHLPERRKRGNFLFLFESPSELPISPHGVVQCRLNADAYEDGLVFRTPLRRTRSNPGQQDQLHIPVVAPDSGSTSKSQKIARFPFGCSMRDACLPLK